MLIKSKNGKENMFCEIHRNTCRKRACKNCFQLSTINTVVRHGPENLSNYHKIFVKFEIKRLSKIKKDDE